MIIDPTNPNHIIADEGKVFKRIGHNDIFGNEIYLGYSWYIDGVLQDPPHKDEIEDFEEIDEPEPKEEAPIDEPEPKEVEPINYIQ